MFALPGQTYEEIAETGDELVESGVDQVAAYPLFLFPYTPMGKTGAPRNHGISESLKRRKMLRILERSFIRPVLNELRSGLSRVEVWRDTVR